jgi:tetratricopeptide (TPR) repeat protein
MAKIYISSTYSDLKECREALYRALRSMGHEVIAMEDYVATDERPLDKCLADVASCDLYVGIFAWRYGYVPDRDKPEKKSITELEYRCAVANNIPCLIFLLDENAPWARAQMESGKGAKKLQLLRAELGRDYTVSFFKTCEQLATQASAAVPNWIAKGSASAAGDKKVALAAPKVSISRLPVTGSQLFGRDAQLERLDEAWEADETHVLTLVAWGGVGKSALVNYWLARMARDDYRGAERVYAWSFYSQGTTDRAISADQFIEAALTWFDDPDPNKGSPWDKGERLAQLVARQRTLLILDGLEPLQHPPGADEGRLKDQALQSLLRSLAAHNRGLCVISTRVAVADLAPFENTTAPRIDLETLSPEAGAQVLTAQGVKGTEYELKRASEEFGGHSLALTLLGSYLADVYGGDITRRTEVDIEGDVRHGGHAQRVMASYEKWFGEGAELSVLRILGLFNRPADKGSIDALRVAPAILGLTNHLQGLSETQWQQTLSKLRRAKLLAAPSPNQPDTLDTHPLVREHFGHQLKRDNPDAWREGNNRLYEHLTRTTKELPDTIEEMAPLFAAIVHGCEAGRHQEALDEVFFRRIRRGSDAFSMKNLGAFGADLTALRNFFAFPWQQPIPRLTESDKAYVMSEAAFDLRALGKLRESTHPMLAGLKASISQKNWLGAATTADNLSNTYLIIGDLSQALVYAQQGIEFADQSGNSVGQIATRITLANILHQAISLSKAEEAFRKAEKMLNESQSQLPLLYSVEGFYYCEFLLAQGKYKEVQTHIGQTLVLVTQQGLLLDIALDCLSMGRAYLLQAQRETTGNLAEATDWLNRAVNGLRQAASLPFLPPGLLARAELYRVTGEFEREQTDLDEAMSIAQRGSMGLHEADCYLEYARLYLARGEREKAQEGWERAKGMIERMGYHRRDKDVREIEEQLKAAGG